jgi:hypothetical protein
MAYHWTTISARALPRAAGRIYYGWVVLAIAALAMVGTLPGRTQGLGLITEPLIRDLGITRVAYAQINLVATLVGSLFCFGVGRVTDSRGGRIVVTAASAALGAVVLTMSRASGLAAMVVLITLTRGIGQSALSIVSLAMVGKWFRRRLTRAMAAYAVITSVGFMAAFPIVGASVAANGWRVAWASIGFALLLGLAPAAWIFVRSSPEAVGLELDGGDEQPVHLTDAQATLTDALRSPAFWVFALASSVYGLVASGIGLFNESILAERGFAPEIYHRALAVMAITGLAGNFAAGAFADRGSLRRVLIAALLILTCALIALPHVVTVTHVMAQAVTVLASAVGPLLLALCVDATGSYTAAFYALAVVVAALAGAAAIVPVPAGAEG